MPEEIEIYGKLQSINATWRSHMSVDKKSGKVLCRPANKSPTRHFFTQGATFVPRCFRGQRTNFISAAFPGECCAISTSVKKVLRRIAD